jgi:predicted amidohydrolase YtcJ
MSRTLLRGGRVHSPTDPRATALLVEDGHVAWVGSDSGAAAHADGADRVVDLAGALVTPAFVDAHVHSTATGMMLSGLDLRGCASLPDCLALVEAETRRLGGGPVVGMGWDETRWPEHRPPTRAELDRAAFGGAVFLMRVDVHSSVVSSAMLAAAPHVRSQTGFSESGHLTESAHVAARMVVQGGLSPAQRSAAQRATRTRAAELGIGAYHELGGPEISSEEDFRSMMALAAEPGTEVVGYWGELGGVEKARELGALGAAGDLFADGAIGSHTACLRTVYADADTRGTGYLTAAQVRDHVVACARAGLQAGFHAIGDATMETVVRGFEEAAAVVGPELIRGGRHRIEHAEMLDDDLVARMAALGVYASVQPMFDALWGGTSGMYADRLGADRALTLNPFASLAAAGIPLALGSDTPVTPLGPWEAVRAAAYHHVAGQRLTVRAAFAAHTRGGWRAAGRDDVGVLAPGQPATYAIWDAGELVVQAPDEAVRAWSTDPRSGVPGLPDLAPGQPVPTCLRTAVRGEPVYDSGAL